MAVALMLSGCGGGGGSSSTTSSSSRSPAASGTQIKPQFNAAIRKFNQGRDKYQGKLQALGPGGNPVGLKSASAALRTVYFDLDKQLRGIPFPPQLNADYNAVLDADRTVIASLDAVGTAANKNAFIFVAHYQIPRGTFNKAANRLFNDVQKLKG